jgi:hypothetical protein
MAKRSSFSIAAVSIAALLLITGCSLDAGNDGEDSGEQAEVSVPDTLGTELVLPEGVTAEGVLLAAYLLTSGDITRAVEEALVSPAEVDLAREALTQGSLQEWVERASKKNK